MLFQDDTHQLTARPDAGLGDELLKCGFDRTLRHPDSRRNLLVRKTLKHTGEHLLFPLREWPCSIVLWGSDLSSEGGLQLLLVQPHLVSHHVTNCLCQQCGRVVFSKNSRNPRADKLRSHACVHTCRHNENLSLESLFLCQAEKLPPIALAKIEIKEHDIDRLAPQNLQTLSNCAAVSSNFKSRLCSEETTRTLAKQGVIV